MTANELKSAYLDANPEGHYFDEATMKHFGDTMANYRVEKVVDGYILHRKNPVKLGCYGSHFFDNDFNFKGIYES